MHLISYLLLSALLILRCNLQDLSCGKFKKSVGCKERFEILNVHNRIRQAAALGILMKNPMTSMNSAPNMIELVWNKQIAKRAESWARTCNFGHDITIGRIWSGNPEDTNYRLEMTQNMAFVWSRKKGDEARWTRTIQYWFTGHFRSDNSGYYRVISWANTSLIGCGIEYYKHKKLNYVKIYVCNYATGGNIENKQNEVAPANCTLPGLIPSKTYLGLCEKNKPKVEHCTQ